MNVGKDRVMEVIQTMDTGKALNLAADIAQKVNEHSDKLDAVKNMA